MEKALKLVKLKENSLNEWDNPNTQGLLIYRG